MVLFLAPKLFGATGRIRKTLDVNVSFLKDIFTIEQITQSPCPATINYAVSYEQILRQTHISHTTIYVGNLPHFIKEHELAPFFQQFGYVLDIRLQGERGFAFVK